MVHPGCELHVVFALEMDFAAVSWLVLDQTSCKAKLANTIVATLL